MRRWFFIFMSLLGKQKPLLKYDWFYETQALKPQVYIVHFGIYVWSKAVNGTVSQTRYCPLPMRILSSLRTRAIILHFFCFFVFSTLIRPGLNINQVLYLTKFLAFKFDVKLTKYETKASVLYLLSIPRP